MEFYDYKSLHQKFAKSSGLSATEFYERTRAPHGENQEENHVILLTEKLWYERVRPYYKVYPSFVGVLEKARLNLPIDALPVYGPILIRMPKNLDRAFTTMLITHFSKEEINKKIIEERIREGKSPIVPVDQNGIFVVAMWTKDSEDSSRQFMRLCRFTGRKTIQESIDEFAERDGLWGPCVKAIKLATSVLLLSGDREFIKPEVLADDREAFERTGDPKFIERAKKRGVVGFTVGKEYETIPHFRRPHFGIRYTGKGGEVPKLVPVKGAIVHREKMKDVPTGYILPNDQEVEVNP